MLTKLTVAGYRGFAKPQSMSFAVPNGNVGSGETFITGSNNSGKSTILEAIRARAGHQSPSFSSGKRNAQLDAIEIRYEVNGTLETVKSIKPGSSETLRSAVSDFEILVLQSRRAFAPYFGKNNGARTSYINSYALPTTRTSQLQGFEGRLFAIEKAPDPFNQLLKKVLGFEPAWSIDMTEEGSYYLKFVNGGGSHSSDGLGEGIVSIFAIIDALYDSAPGGMVVIDEPELSLHPSLQKRLSGLLAEYAKDRQIVISTHSPYFVDLPSLANGAHLVRLKSSQADGTSIHELSTKSKAAIQSMLKDVNNPHVFGINGRELFFQEDGIILTEGQEDVVLYPEVFSQVGFDVPGAFFGWGVGGADKMEKIAAILHDLGFAKVAGILDGDKEHLVKPLQIKFPEYFFATIPAKDIRTKPPRAATDGVAGLLDEKRALRTEHADAIKDLAIELTRRLE